MGSKLIPYFVLFLLVGGCIEPYKFVIQNNVPTLVVEAFLSDKSFNETLSYPSDGRYFTVKLTSTGDVTNERSKVISYASVKLMNDQDEEWRYTESLTEPGVYELLNKEFKAMQGVRYKLHIDLPNEEVYESQWEMLPSILVPSMGTIGFKEIEVEKYVIEAQEEKLIFVKGVRVEIDLPENGTESPLYYKWNFVPHWIYVAPLSPSIVSPGHTCWATNPLYIGNYTVQLDHTGGYKQNLFFMETVRNERLFERFSALIVQHAMTEEYYYFWKEMQEQNLEGEFFDKPPFNLSSNIHALNKENKVSGYFGVVNEQAIRWYFDIKDLSYSVNNTLRGDCLVNYGTGEKAPSCTDCREYHNGDATDIKPSWWGD